MKHLFAACAAFYCCAAWTAETVTIHQDGLLTSTVKAVGAVGTGLCEFGKGLVFGSDTVVVAPNDTVPASVPAVVTPVAQVVAPVAPCPVIVAPGYVQAPVVVPPTPLVIYGPRTYGRVYRDYYYGPRSYYPRRW
ncbi:MAG: hypothetical protein MJ016_07685 [Victivallaceae bacterium]|nr:hypothetical protein [Victivallaceae bacterium]